MEHKIKNQSEAVKQIHTSASFLILSSITAILFVGDKNSFKENKSNLLILYTAGILTTICIFINLYILIYVNRHMKNTKVLLGSNTDINLIKEYHNYSVPKLHFSISLFWFSTICFLLSVYCLIVFKLDIVTGKNKNLFFIFTLMLVICFVSLFLSDFKDRQFFNKNNISIENIGYL